MLILLGIASLFFARENQEQESSGPLRDHTSADTAANRSTDSDSTAPSTPIPHTAMATSECGSEGHARAAHHCSNCSAVLTPYSLQRDNCPSTTVAFLEKSRVRSRSGSMGKDEIDCRANIPILASDTPLISRSSGHDLVPAMDTAPQQLKEYLWDHGVHVERVTIWHPSIYCVIRVLEIEKTQAKEVFVRFTFDHWRTHLDQEAIVSQECCDGVTTQFKATLRIPQDGDCAQVEFAVCYKSAGAVYWDNNGGSNYHFKLCRPNSLPPTPVASPTRPSARDVAV